MFFLKEFGIAVSQENLDQTYFTGSQTLDLRINNSNDWFDIFATVTFGTFSFPFIRLRKYILNQIREFKLPDGEIAILPEEWFARYHNVFSFGKVSDNSIRLQNFHFMLISEIADEHGSLIRDRIDSLTFDNMESLDIPG